MKKILALAAAGEATMGLILLVYPPIAVRLLFGAEIAGVGVVMSRIAGISLITLGLACWPGRAADGIPVRAFRGMLCYSLLTTLYLVSLGLGREWVGILLWPAMALHIILTFLLAGALFKDQQAKRWKGSAV